MRDIILVEAVTSPAYVFVTNCVSSSNGDEISAMVDRARPISYQTFLRQIGREQAAEVFPGYDWSARPTDLTLARDWHVAYYRSRWHDTNVVFAVHSAIEYIFVRRDQLPLLRGKQI
jgi:hypothetical protein